MDGECGTEDAPGPLRPWLSPPVPASATTDTKGGEGDAKSEDSSLFRTPKRPTLAKACSACKKPRPQPSVSEHGHTEGQWGHADGTGPICKPCRKLKEKMVGFRDWMFDPSCIGDEDQVDVEPPLVRLGKPHL